MATDLTFDTYRQEIARKATETVGEFLNGPAGRYRRGDQSWRCGGEPVPYPGCTVLAKPYPIGTTAREVLHRWQDSLADRSAAFVPVPGDTFHMRVADVLSGAAYVELQRMRPDRFIHERMSNILSEYRLEGIDGIICGVGAFPSSVVAFVDFETPTAYRILIVRRDAIYGDVALAKAGVCRRFPFIGHITLGYIESDAPEGIDAGLLEIRQALTSPRFTINAAGLFVFSDMSHYHEPA